jgi:hypothetical protein
MRREIAEAEAAAITAEIHSAAREQRAPHVDAAALADWVAIIERMLRAGEFDAVEHTVRHLQTEFPRLAFARNMCQLFDHLPAEDGQVPFQDQAGKEVQIVRRPGADAVIFLFCGFANRLGLPLAVMHRWFGKLPAHLVYLRDSQRQYYLQGIRSLGPDRAITVRELQRIARRLRARRLLCFATSGGVFAALQYGVLLKADRVLCIAGPTNIAPEFNAHSKRDGAVPPSVAAPERTREKRKKRRAALAEGLADTSDSAARDLDARYSYETAEHPPRTLFLFASDNWDDRIQAENLRDLPSITLRELPDTAEHNIVPDLVWRDELDALLAWLVEPEPRRETAFARYVPAQLRDIAAMFGRLRRV